MKIFNKSEWKKVKLGDVCDLRNGVAIKSEDYVNISNTLNCRMSNIRPDGTFNILYNAKYLPDNFSEKYKNYLLNDGDLVIAMTDMASDPKILGVPTVVKTDGFSIIQNQRVGKLELLTKDIDENYLKLVLQSKKSREYFKKFSIGGVQLNLSKKEILNVPIVLANINEQKKLARLFKLIEDFIKFSKEELQKLNFLNKSLFTKYSKNKKVVNLELEKICEFIKDGTHQTPTYVNTNKNGYKFLSSKDVSKGIINWNTTKYISEELHKELYKKIAPQKNDILLAKNGTTGIAALVDKEEIFDIYVSLAILRLKKEYNPKYILESINSIETNQQFKRSLKGIGVPNLHLKEIKKVKIPIPPIELQNKFAERAEKIEKLSFEIEKSIKEAENVYNSLMNKYFE